MSSSKNITLAELTEALKPIKECLLQLATSVNVKSNESTQILINIEEKVKNISDVVEAYGSKLDDISQSTNLDQVEESKVKKPAAKKAAAKKVAVSTTEADDTDEPVAETVTKITKVTKVINDDIQYEENATPAPIKTVAKTAVKKAVKKVPVKAVRPINKMEYFSKMFSSDEKYFNDIITSKDRAAIAATANNWEDVPEEQLQKVKCSAYYNFMKNNYDDKLQLMKAAYIDDIAINKIDIVEKQE